MFRFGNVKLYRYTGNKNKKAVRFSFFCMSVTLFFINISLPARVGSASRPPRLTSCVYVRSFPCTLFFVFYVCVCCALRSNRLPGSVNVAKVLACVVAGLAPINQGATENVFFVLGRGGGARGLTCIFRFCAGMVPLWGRYGSAQDSGIIAGTGIIPHSEHCLPHWLP